MAVVPDALPILVRWLERRATFAVDALAPVFCTVSTGTVRGKQTRPGTPLKREYVRVLLNRARARAGLGKSVRTHLSGSATRSFAAAAGWTWTSTGSPS